MPTQEVVEAKLTCFKGSSNVPAFVWEGQVRTNEDGFILFIELSSNEQSTDCPKCTDRMVLRMTYNLGDPANPNPDAQIVEITVNPYIFPGGHFNLLPNRDAFTRFCKQVTKIIREEDILWGILQW